MLAPRGSDQFDVLHRMVASRAAADSVLLDVGAGCGDHDHGGRLRGIVGHVVGVDPSPGILANRCLDERFQSTLEDFAPSHRHRFDLAVASYVVEHVAAPTRFLAAMRECLKPGGSAFILTPNLFHYFGASAFVARRLHIDEWALRRIRDHATLDHHHFPLQYRLNSRRRLVRLGRRAGFRAFEFLMLDEPGIYEPYLPRPLGFVPVAWSGMVHRLGAAGLAGTLLARLEA
ncbi:MAG TPA: methyltransferase domain-containing protein [Acidimicrobiales bacterium]